MAMKVFHWTRSTRGPRNTTYDLIFTHPEVPVESSETSKLINALGFIAIVFGEAHLGNDR